MFHIKKPLCYQRCGTTDIYRDKGVMTTLLTSTIFRWVTDLEDVEVTSPIPLFILSFYLFIYLETRRRYLSPRFLSHTKIFSIVIIIKSLVFNLKTSSSQMSHCITVPMAHALGAAGPPDDIHGGTVHTSLSLVFLSQKTPLPTWLFKKKRHCVLGARGIRWFWGPDAIKNRRCC